VAYLVDSVAGFIAATFVTASVAVRMVSASTVAAAAATSAGAIGGATTAAAAVGDRPKGPLKQWGNPYPNSCINIS
jgi:hypothetical protein